MESRVEICETPESIGCEWDLIADFYFQRREFLIHLQRYNPCSQRYYMLYDEDKIIAGAVVYTFKVNLLTFLHIPSPLKMRVIGLPVSVATSPVIGQPAGFIYLLKHILDNEKGFILGLNMMDDYLTDRVLNMRTLPTFLISGHFDSTESYENALRHNYRRRLHRFRGRFLTVREEISDCSLFSSEHYRLYLEIMRRTRTKLETISMDLFRNLPSNFTLTTYYNEKDMLCWHITCLDGKKLTFFFGGMDYKLRGQFQSYHNNLFGILSEAIEKKCDVLDLGQTAETAKMRLGGIKEERKMFLFHRNPLILNVLLPFKRFLTYSNDVENCNVFKSS